MRRKTMNIRILSFITALFCYNAVFAQPSTFDDVHLFQTFFEDASFNSSSYGEGGLAFADYNGFSLFSLGVRGAVPVQTNFQIGGSLYFQNLNPQGFDSRSGVSDLLITGRYKLSTQRTRVNIGGKITLPIGGEDIGQGNTNFGAFAAVRHPASPSTVVTGAFGLEFIEIGNDRKASVLIGGGAIFQIDSDFHIVTELNIQTQIDFILLNGGVDYVIARNGRLRGNLGVGIDDGAPDLLVGASYLISFR
jgi:hypothetical protein